MKHAWPLVLVAACSSATTPPASPTPAEDDDGTRGIAGAIPREECDGLVVLTVTPDAVELDRVARSVPRRGGRVAADALRAELEPADEHAPCAQSVVIAARGELTYQDLVDVMDVAVGAGRIDVSLVGGRTAMYPTPRRRKQPTDKEVIDSLGEPRVDPANTPVLVVTTTSVTLRLRTDGRAREVVIDDVAPLGDESALQSLQETLREARSAAKAMSEGVIVLQADRSVAAKLVIDTTGAAKAAGYDQILFAVQNSHRKP